MNLQKLIDDKEKVADWMVEDITHICKIPAARVSCRPVNTWQTSAKTNTGATPRR